jgi:hypothetical protein
MKKFEDAVTEIARSGAIMSKSASFAAIAGKYRDYISSSFKRAELTEAAYGGALLCSPCMSALQLCHQKGFASSFTVVHAVKQDKTDCIRVNCQPTIFSILFN